MARTGKFVITRFDQNAMRSKPIPGQFFDNMADAIKAAERLNKSPRYSRQFLMVDLASAFTA